MTSPNVKAAIRLGDLLAKLDTPVGIPDLPEHKTRAMALRVVEQGQLLPDCVQDANAGRPSE